MTSRWEQYRTEPAEVADGWSFEVVTPPSALAGCNGMTLGPDGRLYATQVFGSQVTAIDVDSGVHEVFSPLGSGIVGPDDAIFGADGTLYATEPLLGRVTARDPDGSYRVVRDDLPAANGITMDHERRRLFVDEFRPGGRLLELDAAGRGEPRVLLEDLNGPNALAMGPDGRLYFPQVFANEIWAYDLDAGEAQLVVEDLDVPTAVKFDSRGRIVTSESGAGRITAVDLATDERETLAEVPRGIDNVSVGAGDRIFVSHYTDGRVAEETGGRTRVLAEPGLLGPHGLALGANGRLLIADGLSVAAVDTAGVVDRMLRLLIELHTLAIGVCELDGDLVVLAATGELLRYPAGSTAPSVLATGLEGPTSVVADGAGVLVVEAGAGRVTHVAGDGSTRTVLDGLHQPAATARDDRGDLYVSQGGGAPVVVVTAGGERRQLDVGARNVQGVAVAGATLLVADVADHRLVTVDVGTGDATVSVSDAPIGQPVDGLVPAAFCSICPDGAGGFLVGCNGDGSVRRLRRR